jgi:hypothetical protein
VQGTNGGTKALQYTSGSKECTQMMPAGWEDWLPAVGQRPANASSNIIVRGSNNTTTAAGRKLLRDAAQQQVRDKG